MRSPDRTVTLVAEEPTVEQDNGILLGQDLPVKW
jgi:hypothetical protein